MPSVLDSLPHFHATDRRAWRRWLQRNHDRATGVWLIYYKQGSGGSRVSYNDAVEEALCFGWIDSIVRRLDEARYVQLFTPRKAKSTWSRSNKVRVERLIAAGLMTDAGFAKIEAAKSNGSWNALDSVEALEIPRELARALKASPAAGRHFSSFSNSVKKGLLAWIASAKKPETRAARIDKTVRMAARGLRAQFDKE